MGRVLWMANTLGRRPWREFTHWNNSRCSCGSEIFVFAHWYAQHELAALESNESFVLCMTTRQQCCPYYNLVSVKLPLKSARSTKINDSIRATFRDPMKIISYAFPPSVTWFFAFSSPIFALVPKWNAYLTVTTVRLIDSKGLIGRNLQKHQLILTLHSNALYLAYLSISTLQIWRTFVCCGTVSL